MFLPHQMLGGYGDFLYQTGMVDELQKQFVDKQTGLAAQLIQQQKWVEAYKVSRLNNVGRKQTNANILNKVHFIIIPCFRFLTLC